MQPVFYGFRVHTGGLEEGLDHGGLYMLKCSACLVCPKGQVTDSSDSSGLLLSLSAKAAFG